MLTEAQLQIRRQGLTATDMTIVAGVHPYGRSVHDVYLDKMAASEPIEPTAAMKLGHRLEPVALALLGEERGLVITRGTTEAHPIMPWVIATPDGNVVANEERVAVAEAKLVGFRMAHRWGENGDEDTVPDDVRVQVQWQMVCTRTKRAHVVALLGTEVRFYEVEHQEDLATALLELGDNFWKRHILAKSPPAIDGSEASARMVRGLFRKSMAGIAPAPAEADFLVHEYLAAKKSLADAERVESAAKARLCALIGEHEGLEGPDWIATWKERAGSPDWKAVAKNLGATEQMAEQYRRDGARVLLVKTTGQKKGGREAA